MKRFDQSRRTLSTRTSLNGFTVCLTFLLAGCGGGELETNTSPSDSTETAAAGPADSKENNPVSPETPAVAQNTTAGEPPPQAAPEESKPKPPAEPKKEPKVTVDDNPGPPATAEQAAELLDLRTFPVLERANIYGTRQSLGELYYTSPGDIATAFTFQREELKKRGWQELPGSRETGENPAATFTQKGFLVSVSVSSTGQGPNGESGWTSVSLNNHGNVLASKLPVPEGVELFYPMIAQASYTTKAPIAETAQACKNLLMEAGWQPYGQHESESPVGASHTLEFKQNAVLLTANISTHSNQPGKTFLSYSTKQLTADIPAPPNAPGFRYTDSDKRMLFQTKDSPQDVAAHYVEVLGKAGWKPTTEKLVSTDQRQSMMVFRDDGGNRIDLDITSFDDFARVELRHLTPADIAELERRIEELAAEKKREAAARDAEMARRRKAMTYEFPIPKQAKKFELEDDADGITIIMPGGTGPAALAALREHFEKAGWKADSFSADGPAGTLIVKRGDSRLWMQYLNIDKTEDFELDVNCFRSYLKPIEVKEKKTLSP